MFHHGRLVRLLAAPQIGQFGLGEQNDQQDHHAGNAHIGHPDGIKPASAAGLVAAEEQQPPEQRPGELPKPVKGLGKVQAGFGGFRGTERRRVGVGRRFQTSEPERDDEQGEQEEREACDAAAGTNSKAPIAYRLRPHRMPAL